MRLAGNDVKLQRIVRYNYAVVAYRLGRRLDAAKYATHLAEEYVVDLGLRWSDIVFVNPPVIAASLGQLNSERQDAVKHLADCLELFARSGVGQDATLARINAVKLYTIALAPTSVVKTGLDAVDDLLRTTDPATARMFIEGTLLPVLREFKLLSHVVEVRAQYAVVLAYCGDASAASAELAELRSFADGLPGHVREEFENQSRLVDTILRHQSLAS